MTISLVPLMACSDKDTGGEAPSPHEVVHVTTVRGGLWVYDPSVVPLGEAELGVADPLDGQGGVVRLLPFGAEPWAVREASLDDTAVFVVTAGSDQSAQGKRLAGTQTVVGDLTAIAADEQGDDLYDTQRRLSLYRSLVGHATREAADAWWTFDEFPSVFAPGDMAGLDADGDGAEELWVLFGGFTNLLCGIEPDVVGSQPEPVAEDCIVDCSHRPIRSSAVDVDGDGRVEIGAVCTDADGLERVWFLDGTAPGGAAFTSAAVSSVVGTGAEDWSWGAPEIGVATADSDTWVSWPVEGDEDPCMAGWVTAVGHSGVTEVSSGAKVCTPTGAPGSVDINRGGASEPGHVLLSSGTAVWSAPLGDASLTWTELTDLGEPVVGLRSAEGDRAVAILEDGLALIWYPGVRAD